MIIIFSAEKTEQHMFSNNENENLIFQFTSNIKYIVILIEADYITFFTSANEHNQLRSESDSI